MRLDILDTIKHAIPKPVSQVLSFLWQVSAILIWYAVLPATIIVRFSTYAAKQDVALTNQISGILLNPLVLVLIWLMWLVIVAFVRRDDTVRIIFGTIIAGIFMFFAWIMLFVVSILVIFEGSYSASSFVQAELAEELQGQDLLFGGSVRSVDRLKNPLITVSPDEKWQLVYVYKIINGDTRPFLELVHATEKKEVLSVISQAPGMWDDIYWFADSSQLVACHLQASGNPTDAKFSETCFLYNIANPGDPIVVQNPENFVKQQPGQVQLDDTMLVATESARPQVMDEILP